MAPEVGITKVNFALISHNHGHTPWNEVVEKQHTNVMCFNPINRSSKWNESNKPVKHYMKIESNKKAWNDVNSKESTSHFKYDQKQRDKNIQSNSINLSVLSKGKVRLDRNYSFYSDNLSYTSKKKIYNQMNISELSLSFNTNKKQWNEICDQIPNEYFSVKTIPRKTMQNERRNEQHFTVKSVSPNMTSLMKNKISQELSFENQASICITCKDYECINKCHCSPTKTK